MEFTVTENNDKAFTTSGNACLDFFTRITRNAPIADCLDTFSKAWHEDKEIAFKLLMNMRDARNGRGEKLIPIVIMVYLKFTISIVTYEAILRQIVKYGYWKDLLRIIEIESRARREKYKKAILNKCPIEVQLFVEQLKKDAQIFASGLVVSAADPVVVSAADPVVVRAADPVVVRAADPVVVRAADPVVVRAADPVVVSAAGPVVARGSDMKVAISLCAKWAPSEKTHYDHHPMFVAANIMAAMGLTPKQYRQMLTNLRNHLCILETLMATKRYEEIDFSKLPSIAFMKTKRAFSRDTNASGIESDSRKKLHLNYQEYLAKLAIGKTKVNVRGIQPHELVSEYLKSGREIDPLVEAQWNTLKESVLKNGAFTNATAIVDVSGSMAGKPMQVAIALGILVAECTVGLFHGKIITFHSRPSWYHLTGETLKDKVDCLKTAPWGASTNLRATFEMILSDAKDTKLAPDQMAKTLFIFTDMQFDECTSGSWESTFEYVKRSFEENGYRLPNIVCWNLRTSSSKSIPVRYSDEGFVMLSGFSSELLKCIIDARDFSPYAMMMHILEPYDVPFAVKKCTNDILVLAPDMRKCLESAIVKSSIKRAFIENATTKPNYSFDKSDTTIPGSIITRPSLLIKRPDSLANEKGQIPPLTPGKFHQRYIPQSVSTWGTDIGWVEKGRVPILTSGKNHPHHIPQSLSACGTDNGKLIYSCNFDSDISSDTPEDSNSENQDVFDFEEQPNSDSNDDFITIIDGNDDYF